MATHDLPGRLIVFEGVDGAGKSTQIRRLDALLRARGATTRLSREPTDGPDGARIRSAAARHERLPPDEELRLFIEDRRAHVRDLILPALAAGQVVLLDRYFPSTVAYQGARGHDADALLDLNRAFAPDPDLLLIFDLPPEVGLARIRDKRQQQADDFEIPDLLRHSRAIFQRLASILPNAHLIDADRDEDAVAAEIAALVTPPGA